MQYLIIYTALVSTVSCDLPLPSSAEGDPEMVKYLESMWKGYSKARTVDCINLPKYKEWN